MKILLLMPKFPHMWWVKQPPIGALYTASVVKEEGHDIYFYDLRYEEQEAWKQQITESDLINIIYI